MGDPSVAAENGVAYATFWRNPKPADAMRTSPACPITTRSRSTALVLSAFLAYGVLPRDAGADPMFGLEVFWDFNAGALGADTTANDRDLSFRANSNAYGGAGALPTNTGGVGGGTALQLPAPVYDLRMGAPGTFWGDIFGPDPFAGGDAYRADGGPGVDVFDLNLPAGYAFQTWVNFDSLPLYRYQTLLAKSTDMGTSHWQGWNLSMYRSESGASHIEFASKTGHGAMAPLLAPISLVTDAWYHVLVNASVTGSSMLYDLHINGTLVASQTNGLVNAVDDPLRLGHVTRSYGGVPDLWSSALLGSLDQVAFWNRSLTSDDIGTLYNDGRGFSFGSPVPEQSSTLALIGFGMVALAALGRRSRRAA